MQPGQEVTYTLTFTNRSTDPDAAPVGVDYTDHMADVLDDADLTAQPETSHDDLTAAVDGDTIRVTGSIPPGETRTVIYTVTVKAHDELGNQLLGNVVAVTGEAPTCAEGTALCTEHGVSGTPPPGPTDPPSTPGPGRPLPSTGATVGPALTLVALLSLAGGALVAAQRRDARRAA